MPDITSNLLRWFKLDNDYTDSSGMGGTTGTPTGSPSFVSGHINQAINITTNTQYIDFGSTTLLHGATAATWAFWIYPNDLTGNGRFFGQWGDSGSGDQVWTIIIQPNGKLLAATQKAGYQVIPCATAISTGVWTHVAVTWAAGSTNGFLFYINGSLVSQDSPISTATITAMDNIQSSHIILGYEATSAGSGATCPLCYVDDVRIYSRVLSSGDISALYVYTGSSGTPYAMDPLF